MNTAMHSERGPSWMNPWWVTSTVVLWVVGWFVVFTDYPWSLAGQGDDGNKWQSAPVIPLAISALPLVTSFGWLFFAAGAGRRRSGVIAIAVSFAWVAVVGVAVVSLSFPWPGY